MGTSSPMLSVPILASKSSAVEANNSNSINSPLLSVPMIASKSLPTQQQHHEEVIEYKNVDLIPQHHQIDSKQLQQFINNDIIHEYKTTIITTTAQQLLEDARSAGATVEVVDNHGITYLHHHNNGFGNATTVNTSFE